MENKTKVQCQACDTENDPDETRCRRCGLPLVLQESGETECKVACPRCQYLNSRGSFFCYSCGKYFADSGKGQAEESNKQQPGEASLPKARVVMPGGSEIILTGSPTFIERSDFDGTLPQDILMSISRQHLLVNYDNGIYYVQDYGHDGKGSTNHTRLNGNDIFKKGKQPLKDGDKIELATQPELTLTFRLLSNDTGETIGNRI